MENIPQVLVAHHQDQGNEEIFELISQAISKLDSAAAIQLLKCDYEYSSNPSYTALSSTQRNNLLAQTCMYKGDSHPALDEIMYELLEQGAEPDQHDCSGIPLFHILALHKNTTAIYRFHYAQANLCIKNKSCETILHTLVGYSFEEAEEIIRLITTLEPRLLTEKTNQGFTPIELAAEVENYPLVSYLSELPSELAISSPTSSTPTFRHPYAPTRPSLITIMQQQGPDVVGSLLERGALQPSDEDVCAAFEMGFHELAMAMIECASRYSSSQPPQATQNPTASDSSDCWLSILQAQEATQLPSM